MGRARGMLAPILLLALLVVLAWLQFRWTGQIARDEKVRLSANLRSSLGRFSRDVDDEVASVFRHFRIDPSEDLETSLGEAWDRYRDEALYPDLVESVYFTDANGALKRLQEETLNPIDWPRELSRLRERLDHRGRAHEHSGRARPPFPLPVLSTDPLAMAVPVAFHRRNRWSRRSLVGYVIVGLDRDVLRDRVLADLSARYFGGEYDVVIVGGRDEERVLYTNVNGTTPTPIEDTADMHSELLSFGRFPERPRPGRDGAGERRPFPPEARRRPIRDLDKERWEIFVRHRSGSLEDAVAAVRARNLAVSFGILGLLAASVVLIALSTRRATELNTRKMEFVAGVSHELRTPLAVLRSAGQNLADGSVSDPTQVKRYGTLIETEGRRLNELVEQVLELAGIQSQSRQAQRKTVSARRIVEEALADCEIVLKERGVSIDTHFPEREVMLVADAEALRRGLRNLIVNAIKHGGEDNTVRVAVATKGETVRFEVSDRGPGIPEAERKHVFDAFYRGRSALDRRVPGSGLGLSLVEHVACEHGGSVELDSAPGGGSRFTLSIPAAGKT